MSFTAKCPKCSANYEAEDDWLGMEAECPVCGESMTIAKAEEKAKLSIRKEGIAAAPPEGAPLCPNCQAALPNEDAVVCIQCGTNLKTGKKMKTKSGGASAAPRQTNKILYGIGVVLCCLFVLGTIHRVYSAISGASRNKEIRQLDKEARQKNAESTKALEDGDVKKAIIAIEEMDEKERARNNIIRKEIRIPQQDIRLTNLLRSECVNNMKEYLLAVDKAREALALEPKGMKDKPTVKARLKALDAVIAKSDAVGEWYRNTGSLIDREGRKLNVSEVSRTRLKQAWQNEMLTSKVGEMQKLNNSWLNRIKDMHKFLYKHRKHWEMGEDGMLFSDDSALSQYQKMYSEYEGLGKQIEALMKEAKKQQ